MTHVHNLIKKLHDLNSQQLEDQNPGAQILCFEIFRTQAHLLSFLGFTVTRTPQNLDECLGIGVEACVKMLEILATLVHYKTIRIPDLLNIAMDSSFLKSGVVIDLCDALNRIIQKELSISNDARLLTTEAELLERLDLFVKYIPRTKFEGAKQRSKERMERSVSLLVQRLSTLQLRVQPFSVHMDLDEIRDQLQDVETSVQGFQSVDVSAFQNLETSNKS